MPPPDSGLVVTTGDTETFEQTHLTQETLGDATQYLLPDAIITVRLFDGDPDPFRGTMS